MNNVFYFKKIGSIGGCESFFYYLSRCYKNLIIYYREGSPEQLKRLAKNVEVKKYNEEKESDKGIIIRKRTNNKSYIY